MVDWNKLVGKKIKVWDGVLEQERICIVKQVSAIENAVEIDWLDRYPSSWYNLDEAEWRFDLIMIKPTEGEE